MKEDKKTAEFRELLGKGGGEGEGKGVGRGRWRDVFGKGGEEVAEMIWKDGIDILVELGGHTAGFSFFSFLFSLPSFLPSSLPSFLPSFLPFLPSFLRLFFSSQATEWTSLSESQPPYKFL